MSLSHRCAPAELQKLLLLLPYRLETFVATYPNPPTHARSIYLPNRLPTVADPNLLARLLELAHRAIPTRRYPGISVVTVEFIGRGTHSRRLRPDRVESDSRAPALRSSLVGYLDTRDFSNQAASRSLGNRIEDFSRGTRIGSKDGGKKKDTSLGCQPSRCLSSSKGKIGPGSDVSIGLCPRSPPKEQDH